MPTGYNVNHPQSNSFYMMYTYRQSRFGCALSSELGRCPYLLHSSPQLLRSWFCDRILPHFYSSTSSTSCADRYIVTSQHTQFDFFQSKFDSSLDWESMKRWKANGPAFNRDFGGSLLWSKTRPVSKKKHFPVYLLCVFRFGLLEVRLQNGQLTLSVGMNHRLVCPYTVRNVLLGLSISGSKYR